MKKKLLSALLCVAMVASLVIGCGATTEEAAAPAATEESASKADGKGVTIGLAMNTTTNAWRAALVAKAQETADAAGAKLIVLDAAGKADKQQADLEDEVCLVLRQSFAPAGRAV